MPATTLPSSCSPDSLFDGRLQCRQPLAGYRFSVDAVLAAHFVLPKAGQRVLDLGCGSGIIGLIIAYRVADAEVQGMELQPELAAIARDNVALNGFAGRMAILRGDVRQPAASVQPEAYDLVVCNPPYGTGQDGRVSQQSQAALARHGLAGDLEDFVRAAAFAVRNRGRVVFIVPARRGADLLSLLRCHRLTPKRMQPIYSYPEAGSAKLVLIEAMKNGGEHFAILAPFSIYQQANGDYSLAMQALYREESCSPP